MMKIMKATKKTLQLTKKKSNLMKKKHRTMIQFQVQVLDWGNDLYHTKVSKLPSYSFGLRKKK